MRHAVAAVLCAAALACVPAPQAPQAPPAIDPGAGAEAQPSSPAATGSLRTDQVTVRIRAGVLEVRITPLDDELLLLLAPDARRQLRSLLDAHGQRAVTAPRGSTMLVSFLSAREGEPFEPTAVAVEVGGQRLRPLDIVPLTDGWGEQRLRAQAAESALYRFDRRIDPFQRFIAHYQALSSDRWRAILPLLDAERVKVRGTSS